MRLVFILPEYPPELGGGIGTFYRGILPAMASAGHRVRVVCGSGLSAGEAASPRREQGVEIETLERGRIERQWNRLGHISATPTLRRHLAGAWAAWEQAGSGADADLIETTDWGLLFAPPVLEAQCPVVVQLHGSNGQIARYDPSPGDEAAEAMMQLIELAGLVRADQLQTNAHANAAWWEKQLARPVEVIPPTLARWAPVAAGERGPNGLVAGRLQVWKGPRVLCEALGMLGEAAPTIEWFGRDTAAGVGAPQTSATLEAAHSDVWGSRLVRKDPVGLAELATLQRRARFVVVPSDWDVFNFTCVEAMAVGTPVICSSGAGASELIEDGRNGFIFAAGDARALAEALRRACDLSDADRERIGQTGRETVLKHLDPVALAPRRIAAYEAAIEGFKGRPNLQGDFLSSAIAPRHGDTDETAFLARLPLKSLIRHSGTRVYEKIVGRRTRTMEWPRR